MSLMNLEPLAALAANQMVYTGDRDGPKNSERIMTHGLAVLTEQGVYAFGLFLATRKREQDVRCADLIHRTLRGLLKETKLYEAVMDVDQATYYRSITAPLGKETPTEALRRLLLTKQLMEVTLTYARYHAKAMNHG